ncbi:ATP-dependent RNA helicase HrpA [Mariprofundus erugo]|uniref:ATP-dependent RNA helicase HrpA n=1 Tax=Mariprofundus erugo TaxID=2528639 RepID=A0A5R9GPS4_9PROT|nr:ATP-dependent RNA helicase HrpA [Mariprofundus erugo]TLS67598.1 ATP-dependent RNA helicase HrpA [Mariprofundus erugo]
MDNIAHPINALLDLLPSCMISDRRAFSKRLHGLRQRSKQGKPVDRALATLTDAIHTSVATFKQRMQSRPVITYPESLPVSGKRQQIADAIERHQVIIIAGETGSGKTTQIPKICLELGRGIAGLIGHTQPRRIAARSVAGRIAAELNSRIGEHVGFKVRFSDHTGPNALIKLMTDGILLAEIQSDPQLLAYDTIVIDEAHERSLNIDFLLGYLKQLLPQRRDLKVIITSATINTARFSAFFDDAPVIEVSGRSYPVEVLYRPIQGDEDELDRDLPQAIADAVDEAASIDPFGDILVFLPGEREIREASDLLHRHAMKHTEVIPLLSRLSPAEQDRVFQSHPGRRIVLATNVAETSLTVPGIRFVIDSGLARISRYSVRTKVQRLPIEPISQASANQRSGRCGRIASGVCFRLYSEESFNNRPEQTDPEIRRTNLASVILQMSNLRLGDLGKFPFMDAPEQQAIRDGYRLLEELQAVDSGRQLTPIGKKLVRLPVDPRIGRMLLQAGEEGALQELLIIAAGLSVQDPRGRPMDMQQQADEKHRSFANPASDFLTWLNMWNWFHEQSRHLSRSKMHKLCHDRFLSYLRLREWHDLHSQLLSIVQEMRMMPNSEPAHPDAVHRALLAGLLSHVGLYDDEKKCYLGARNLRFALFPASPLAKKPPKWVVCSELVETRRLFGRTIAPIDPAWLERLAPHILQHSYSEPHWSSKQAQVHAWEKVTLYGLPVIGRRRIHYGPVDPVISRELFIRHALVASEFRSHGKFLQHNQQLIAELEALEAKQRRRDLLADEQARFEFFDAVIPEGIFSGKLFEQWRKQAEQQSPRLLFLNRQTLLHGDSASVDASAFPDEYSNGKLRLKYSYHFDPSNQADGITLLVPLPVLGQLEPEPFEWLVPGMLVEKLTVLIKCLPKSIRRRFVPAPEFARAAGENMAFAQGDLLTALARELGRMTGLEPHRSDWGTDPLPRHLQMKFSVVDAHGKSLASSHDLRALQEKYAETSRRSLQSIDTVRNIERVGITRWDFGDLPESIARVQNGLSLQFFPALCDCGQTVAIRIFENRHEAARAMQPGLRRLFMLSLHQQVELLKKNSPQLQKLTLLYALIGSPAALKEELIEAAFTALFMQSPLPRTEADFVKRLDAGRSRIVARAGELADAVSAALSAYHGLSQALEGVRSLQLQPVVEDIRLQMSRLIYPGFVAATPAEWLSHFPRFIQAAALRLEKAGRNLKQDSQHRQAISQLWSQYDARQKAIISAHGDTADLETFRWLIEELRVSLFAQELKTSTPVSVKKLENMWLTLR